MKRIKHLPTLEERFTRLSNLMTTPEVERAVVWMHRRHEELMTLCTQGPIEVITMLDNAYWRTELGEEPYAPEELYTQHFTIPDALDEFRHRPCSFAAAWQLANDDRPSLAYSNDLSSDMAATLLGRVIADEYYANSMFALESH